MKESWPVNTPAIPAEEQLIPVRPSVEDIEDQLFRFHGKFEAELAKAKTGDKEALEYITSAKGDLEAFTSAFDVEHGTLTPENQEIYDEITRRRALIQEVLDAK